MILLTQNRPSAIRSFGSKLFGRNAVQPTEPKLVDEYEVYLAGLWDSSTSHAPVEFTGTQEECEAWLADKANVRKNCLNWKQSIRSTGELMEVNR